MSLHELTHYIYHLFEIDEKNYFNISCHFNYQKIYNIQMREKQLSIKIVWIYVKVQNNSQVFV